MSVCACAVIVFFLEVALFLYPEMPKYYCDYCDIYLTHDSPSVRKSHNDGWKHKSSVRAYYAQFEEDFTQNVIDQKLREFESRGGRGVPPFPPFGRGMPFPPPPFSAPFPPPGHMSTPPNTGAPAPFQAPPPHFQAQHG